MDKTPHKSRILLFTLQFPPAVGGVQEVAYQLAKHFSESEAVVSALTLYEPGCESFDHLQPFRILRMPSYQTENIFQQIFQKFRLINRVRKEIENFSPTVIICLNWDPCAYILRIAQFGRRKKIPYFVIAHGMEIMQLPKPFLFRRLKAIFRLFAFKGARKIFAVSHYTKNKLELLGLKKEICVIPNGINQNDFFLNEMNSKKEKKILLSISRLVPRKGHDLVLNALPEVIRKLPGIIYQIAGSGPEKNRLHEIVQELNLEKHVEFLGKVNDEEKEKALQNCDLFVLPCRETPTDFEGFGIVFLEAMQYGKPVIGGKSGGIPEVIEHGKTGLLVKPDDAHELTRAILLILQSPQEAERLGKNAKGIVEEKFVWSKIIKKYLNEVIL